MTARWFAGLLQRLREVLARQHSMPVPGHAVKRGFYFVLGAAVFFVPASCIMFLVGRGVGFDDHDPWALAWFLGVVTLIPCLGGWLFARRFVK